MSKNNNQQESDSLNLDNLFKSAQDPNRAVEVQNWLNYNQANTSLAHELKGQHGESLLHWAAMTHIGLTIDLINKNFDVNIKDQSGRTPLDWITDRLYFTCLNPDTIYNSEIRNNIAKVSDDIGSNMINFGAYAHDPLAIWALTGCWQMVNAQYNRQPDSLYQIGQDNFNILHYWSISSFDSNEDKAFALNFFLNKDIDINVQNDRGITPLYVAVEQWIEGYCPQEHIQLLIQKGADPEIESAEGVDCFLLAQNEGFDTIKKLQEIIDEAETKKAESK